MFAGKEQIRRRRGQTLRRPLLPGAERCLPAGPGQARPPPLVEKAVSAAVAAARGGGEGERARRLRMVPAPPWKPRATEREGAPRKERQARAGAAAG